MFLTHDQRIEIVALSQAGQSYRQLAAQYGVRVATISDLLRKHRETGSVDDLQRSGRPRKSTPRQDRALRLMSSRSPRKGSRGLCQQWAQTSGVQVTPRTVRLRLFQCGRFSYVAPKKPLLTARHRDLRVQWVQERAAWTPQQWRRVLFSDETPLYLVQMTQRRYYRSVRGVGRLRNIIQPRLQSGGGSMMVWGAFSSRGPLQLHRVQGTLNAETYVGILEEHVQPFFDAAANFIYQQDNARPHTARRTMTWFDEHAIEVMPWPPNSPDLNPIENLWAYLKSELDKIVIHGQQELFNQASRIFAATPPDLIEHLIDSMPTRCQQVLDRNGRHCDY